MHKEASRILKQVRNAASLRQRSEVLRNQFRDETAIVFSCGPSLNDVWSPELMQRLMASGKYVVSVKSSYNMVGSVADMYLCNAVRVPKIANGFRSDTLRVGCSCVPHDGLFKLMCHGFDIFYRIMCCPMDRSLMATGRFHSGVYPNPGKPIVERPWGPGILVDMGLFLLMYMGFSRIVVVGWDMGDGVYTHFDNKKNIFNEEKIKKDAELMAVQIPALVSWMRRKCVTLQLCSPQSVLKIPQISVDKLMEI